MNGNFCPLAKKKFGRRMSDGLCFDVYTAQVEQIFTNGKKNGLDKNHMKLALRQSLIAQGGKA